MLNPADFDKTVELCREVTPTYLPSICPVCCFSRKKQIAQRSLLCALRTSKKQIGCVIENGGLDPLGKILVQSKHVGKFEVKKVDPETKIEIVETIKKEVLVGTRAGLSLEKKSGIKELASAMSNWFGRVMDTLWDKAFESKEKQEDMFLSQERVVQLFHELISASIETDDKAGIFIGKESQIVGQEVILSADGLGKLIQTRERRALSKEAEKEKVEFGMDGKRLFGENTKALFVVEFLEQYFVLAQMCAVLKKVLPSYDLPKIGSLQSFFDAHLRYIRATAEGLPKPGSPPFRVLPFFEFRPGLNSESEEVVKELKVERSTIPRMLKRGDPFTNRLFSSDLFEEENELIEQTFSLGVNTLLFPATYEWVWKRMNIISDTLFNTYRAWAHIANKRFLDEEVTAEQDLEERELEEEDKEYDSERDEDYVPEDEVEYSSDESESSDDGYVEFRPLEKGSKPKEKAKPKEEPKAKAKEEPKAKAKAKEEPKAKKEPETEEMEEESEEEKSPKAKKEEGSKEESPKAEKEKKTEESFFYEDDVIKQIKHWPMRRVLEKARQMDANVRKIVDEAEAEYKEALAGKGQYASIAKNLDPQSGFKDALERVLSGGMNALLAWSIVLDAKLVDKFEIVKRVDLVELRRILGDEKLTRVDVAENKVLFEKFLDSMSADQKRRILENLKRDQFIYEVLVPYLEHKARELTTQNYDETHKTLDYDREITELGNQKDAFKLEFYTEDEAKGDTVYYKWLNDGILFRRSMIGAMEMRAKFDQTDFLSIESCQPFLHIRFLKVLQREKSNFSVDGFVRKILDPVEQNIEGQSTEKTIKEDLLRQLRNEGFKDLAGKTDVCCEAMAYSLRNKDPPLKEVRLTQKSHLRLLYLAGFTAFWRKWHNKYQDYCKKNFFTQANKSRSTGELVESEEAEFKAGNYVWRWNGNVYSFKTEQIPEPPMSRGFTGPDIAALSPTAYFRMEYCRRARLLKDALENMDADLRAKVDKFLMP